MKRITGVSLVILGLWACNEKPKVDLVNQKTKSNIETEALKYNTINLKYNNPTVLDSSEWIMYPLTLEELEETEKGFSSSSYGRDFGYWNVAFYNTQTKQARLLSNRLKMLINTISPHIDAASQAGQRKEINEPIIFYSITTKDFNHDGKLNHEDPAYLFISDYTGLALKQVSPDNFELIDWQMVDGKNKVLIEARKDSNKDKKFDGDDETVSFIYDIGTQKIEQVFSDEFNLVTKKLLDKQWTKKK